MPMLERLRHLPRDTRDTLFLLLVIAGVLAPQLGRLPVWCSALALSVLVWRGVLAWRTRPLPSRWWLLGLLLITVAATLMTHRTVLGRDAGVTLLVVLLTLKTLELRARRDAFVVFFLSFFTMLTNFFFSQSLLTAAAMLIALLGLLTALVNTHMPVGKPPLREAAATALTMAALGAPIMLVLFLLFPRLSPLWGMPGDAMTGRSGLSASMEVGAIAELALDDSIAMRVRFDGPPPRQSELYFRGPVLSTLQGRQWLPLRSGFPEQWQDPPNLQVQGDAIRYQVTLEPNSRPWIFVLDAAPGKPDVPGMALRLSRQLQWLTERPVTELLRYTAQSHTAFSHGPRARTAALQDYLELPAGLNPRTLQWAADLRRADPAGGDPAQLIDTVLQRLRTGGYSYTLVPGVYGINTADEFWFDRRAGFCEHIASSFVIMMRALDIPARIVTGYQGGEVNSVDGYWTLRQSDAHAWAEVWLAGRGWVRIDPTAAVAPGRIGSLQRLVAPRGVMATAMEAVNPVIWFNLRASWEALNNRWNQWVLNYSQTTQLNLLKDIGFDSPSWEDLGLLLIGLIVAASVIGAAWTVWDRHRQDPWLRLLSAATRRLAAAGLPALPNSPPRALAQMVRLHWGANDTAVLAVCEWLLRLEAWRYAPPASAGAATLHGLRREFRQLPWPIR
ncbi:MAG: DUF3488 and transglutaminase-like domain-containing protein [Burkholderiaceae bacterium]